MEGLQKSLHHIIHSWKYIGGKEILFIHQSFMKFLDRYSRTLADQEIRSGVDSKLKDLLVRVDKDNVIIIAIKSMANVWMYENHIVSRTSWEFIIYCFPISFAHNRQAVATRYLKRWTGLPRCANPSHLIQKERKQETSAKVTHTPS